MTSGTKLDQARVGLELGELIGELVQAVDAAGHGVAGRVVPAHDQQQKIAEVVHWRHVFGGFAVGEHGDEIEPVGATPFLPELAEVGDTLHQLIDLLLLGIHDTARLGDGEHDVRPPVGTSVFHREVESREHEGGELDGDGVHPVKCFAVGQRVEQGPGALADHWFDVAQVAERRHAANGLALCGVVRRVHRMKGASCGLYSSSSRSSDRPRVMPLADE